MCAIQAGGNEALTAIRHSQRCFSFAKKIYEVCKAVCFILRGQSSSTRLIPIRHDSGTANETIVMGNCSMSPSHFHLPSISSGCSVETWNRRHEVGIFILPDCGVTCESYTINNQIQTSPPTPSWTTSRRRPARATMSRLARPSSSAHEERGQPRRLSMAPSTIIKGRLPACPRDCAMPPCPGWWSLLRPRRLPAENAISTRPGNSADGPFHGLN